MYYLFIYLFLKRDISSSKPWGQVFLCLCIRQSTEKVNRDVLQRSYMYHSLLNTWKHENVVSWVKTLPSGLWYKVLIIQHVDSVLTREDCQKRHLGAFILIHGPSFLNVAVCIPCIFLPQQIISPLITDYNHFLSLSEIIFFHWVKENQSINN